MAPLVTHLVIGERVFPLIEHLDSTPAVYGAFLLGCVLVDVNSFLDIDRRRTHFVGRLAEDGEDAFRKSSANFLDQLGTLLVRPWNNLMSSEQAFVAGYLCHLAADEPWKAYTWSVFQTLGIMTWAELPIPGDVMLTALDVLNTRIIADSQTIASVLADVSIPNVLTHVPRDTFQRVWHIVRTHVLDGRSPESYFRMLKRAGKTGAEIAVVRQQHDQYWEDALAMIRGAGGTEPYIEAAVDRAANTVPLLWTLDRHRSDVYQDPSVPIGTSDPTGTHRQTREVATLDWDFSKTWYHGSPFELSSIRAGSTITQNRALAIAFSHKPTLVTVSDTGRIRHNGTAPGFLYRVLDVIGSDDIHPHPNSAMEYGMEWLTNRELRVALKGPTRPVAEEHLSAVESRDLRRMLEGRKEGDAL